MRIKIKINPKTGVVYLPKYMLDDGFRGEVDAFGVGSVIVLTHPDADVSVIRESIALVLKDVDLSLQSRSRRRAHLPKLQEMGENGGDKS